MKIGIPRGLFFNRYETLLISFFSFLGVSYVISDKTTKITLEEGKRIASQEGCISLKLFLGHVKNLENKCNFILIPRIKSIYKDEKMCSNFLGIYDLCSNLFDFNFIDFNIDVSNGKSEKLAFLDLGLYLGFSYNDVLSSYLKAKELYKNELNNKLLIQTNVINANSKKVLIAGHDYNICDSFFNNDIVSLLEKNKIGVVFSNIFDNKNRDCSFISKEVYFTYSKDEMSAINFYKDYVDGIILISSFPCGLDSLYNEIITSKIKNIPIITISFDEQLSRTGILTRIESFIDILYKENIYE